MRGVSIINKTKILLILLLVSIGASYLDTIPAKAQGIPGPDQSIGNIEILKSDKNAISKTQINGNEYLAVKMGVNTVEAAQGRGTADSLTVYFQRIPRQRMYAAWSSREARWFGGPDSYTLWPCAGTWDIYQYKFFTFGSAPATQHTDGMGANYFLMARSDNDSSNDPSDLGSYDLSSICSSMNSNDVAVGSVYGKALTWGAQAVIHGFEFHYNDVNAYYCYMPADENNVKDHAPSFDQITSGSRNMFAGIDRSKQCSKIATTDNSNTGGVYIDRNFSGDQLNADDTYFRVNNFTTNSAGKLIWLISAMLGTDSGSSYPISSQTVDPGVKDYYTTAAIQACQENRINLPYTTKEISVNGHSKRGMDQIDWIKQIAAKINEQLDPNVPKPYDVNENYNGLPSTITPTEDADLYKTFYASGTNGASADQSVSNDVVVQNLQGLIDDVVAQSMMINPEKTKELQKGQLEGVVIAAAGAKLPGGAITTGIGAGLGLIVALQAYMKAMADNEQRDKFFKPLIKAVYALAYSSSQMIYDECIQNFWKNDAAKKAFMDARLTKAGSNWNILYDRWTTAKDEGINKINAGEKGYSLENIITNALMYIAKLIHKGIIWFVSWIIRWTSGVIPI